tara:strand:+ start:296 stop:472 length:177 start_codon:yes stop_codon:yes gene_type:complete
MKTVIDTKKITTIFGTATVSMWAVGTVWFIGIGPDENGHNKIHHHGNEKYIQKLWKTV